MHWILAVLLFIFSACQSDSSKSQATASIATDSLIELRVQNQAGEESIHLHKRDSAWHISEESHLDLAKDKVEQLFTALKNMQFTDSFVPSKNELKQYGFSPAELTVFLSTEDSKDKTLLFGSYSEFAKKHYCMFKGAETVSLCSEDVYALLSRPADYYVAANLFTFASSEVCSLKLQTKDSKLTLERQDDVWRYRTDTTSYHASEASVISLIDSIKQFQSKNFVKDVSEVAFPIAIDLRLCSKDQLAIRLSALRKDAFDVHAEPIILCLGEDRCLEIERSAAPVLPLSKSYFRVQKPFAFAADNLRKVTFSGSLFSEERTLEKTEDGWSVNSKAADDPFVRSLLRELADVTPDSYVDTDLAGVDQARASKIILFDVKGEGLLNVSLWPSQKAGFLLAQNDRLGELFYLSDAVLKKIFPAIEVLLPVVEAES